MGQKLFTASIEKKLQQQYVFGSDLSKQKVVAKIFNPYGAATFYLLNQDPEDTDYLWAIVDMGHGAEMGSVSKSELERIRVRPFNLPLERDIYFSEVNAGVLFKGLMNGEHFEHGGSVSTPYAKGGFLKAVRRIWKKINGTWHYNEGVGWRRDRAFKNKSEDYEKGDRPSYKSKFEDGGQTEIVMYPTKEEKIVW